MNAMQHITPLVDAVVSHIREGVIVANQTGDILYHNRAASDLLGIADISHIRDIDSNNPALECEALKKRLPFGSKPTAIVQLASNDKHRFEHRITSNGITRFVEFNTSAVKVPGEPTPVHLVVLNDITEKRKLEAVFQDNLNMGLVTQDPSMIEISSVIEQVAKTRAPVLLQGESGTGKTLLAHMLHKKSNRVEKPFIEVNCAAIPESLLESELFGHVKGAFTGAIGDRQGRFQAANGGTLFLDEISEIPLHLQPKLLKAIEEQRFQMVGSDKTIEVDIRIISASNQNLHDLVNQNRFRADLFYSLSVMPVNIPPLRERPGDIPILIKNTCDTLVQRGYPDGIHCNQEAMAMMLDYHWPGNVRELSNAVEHAMILAKDNLVTAKCLPLDIRKYIAKKNGENWTGDGLDVQRQEILDALHKAEGNRAEAARLLSIDRSTLWRRMHRLGIAT